MQGDFSRCTFDQTKHYHAVRMQQGRVQMDADFNEQRDIDAHLRETPHRDLIGRHGGPDGEDASGAPLAGFKIMVDSDGDLQISAGRYYVEGVLCENDTETPWLEQPDFPGATLPTAAGSYLAYLDVWPRHISSLHDPDIREVALGGPDHASRTKMVWQVRLHAFADEEDVSCAAYDVDLPPDGYASTGLLAARAEPAEISDDLCITPAGAGYTGLENQLYRVEIHEGGQNGATPTWLFSRENAAVLSLIDVDSSSGSILVLAAEPRDSNLGYHAGDLVELVDDGSELRGEPGPLLTVDMVEGRTITMTAPVDLSNLLSPKLRRWDAGQLRSVDETGDDGWLDLESGVQVRFDASRQYRRGDYWLIAARTATGDIEWPEKETGDPAEASPHGVRRHYCPLAILSAAAPAGGGDLGWTVATDCRNLFRAAIDRDEETNESLCCTVSIGADGDFKNLVEAIAKLRARGLTALCLCLRPEAHLLDAPIGIEDDDLDLTICGCRGATLTFTSSARLKLSSVSSLVLQDLTINTAAAEAPIIFDGQHLSIERCHLQGAPSSGALLLVTGADRFDMVRSRITVYGQKNSLGLVATLNNPLVNAISNGAPRFAANILSRRTGSDLAGLASNLRNVAANADVSPTSLDNVISLANVLDAEVIDRDKLTDAISRLRAEDDAVSNPGIVILDGGATVFMEGNDISGEVRLYGASAATERDREALLAFIAEVKWNTAVKDGDADFVACGNRFRKSFSVGREAIETITQRGAVALHRRVSLRDNSFDAGDNLCLAADALTLEGNHFTLDSDTAIAVAAPGATCLGNCGNRQASSQVIVAALQDVPEPAMFTSLNARLTVKSLF